MIPGCLSSTGSEILASVSHCLANFLSIFYCFIPNFTLKYEDSENIKIDCVNTFVFNWHQIKQRNFFGTPGTAFQNGFSILYSNFENERMKPQ